MSSLKNSLKAEWANDWNDIFEHAAAKADSMKTIRDKLHNVNAIQTKEEELHFKLLGRLGYNRLNVADVVHVVDNVGLLFKYVLEFTSLFSLLPFQLAGTIRNHKDPTSSMVSALSCLN